MVFVLIGLAAVIVVGVALIAVGQAVGKTNDMPPQIVVDVHEAIAFCAEALPSDVTAVLTFDELRHAIRLHLEWLQAYHWAPDRGAEATDGPIVFEEFDALDYVMERAEVTRLDLSRDHARAVIDVHTSYLQIMGAIHLDDPVQVEADLAQLPLGDDVPSLGVGTVDEFADGDDELDGGDPN